MPLRRGVLLFSTNRVTDIQYTGRYNGIIITPDHHSSATYANFINRKIRPENCPPLVGYIEEVCVQFTLSIMTIIMLTRCDNNYCPLPQLRLNVFVYNYSNYVAPKSRKLNDILSSP